MKSMQSFAAVRYGCLMLALLIMSIQGKAADFETPAQTTLTLQPTLTGGGQYTVLWTAMAETTPQSATLTILLERQGAGQTRLLTRVLKLVAGKQATVFCNFSIPGPGTYKVLSFLRMSASGGHYTKSDMVRFVRSSDGKVRLESEPRLTARTFANKFRPSLPATKPTLRALGAPSFSGFWVRGKLNFTKTRFYSWHTTQTVETAITTFTQPIRGAKVQVCDLISSSSFFLYQVLGTVYPDTNGNFQYYVPSNDDGDGTGRDIFLHLVADSADCKVQDYSSVIYSMDLFPKYAVLNPSLAWEWKYWSMDWPGGTLDMGSAVLRKEQSGPWNIMDAVRQGAIFVRARGETAPKGVIRWASGDPNGTYFNPTTKMITLRGRSDNSDEFDDGVILHEYGHLVANRLSWDKNPGGVHYFDWAHGRPLAWSEGWATFFACAVRGNRFLIDSVNNATAPGLSMDLEQFSDIFAFDYRRGDDVEACVAGALWDIYDGQNDYRDTLCDGPGRLWSIVSNYFSSTRSCIFKDFYDGWVTYRFPGCSQVQAIMNQFGINYSGGLMVNSFLIEGGAELAASRTVKLNTFVSGNPTHCMASEYSTFVGATWVPYSPALSFKLSSGNGYKFVFFKIRSATGQVSTIKFDTIEMNEMRTLTLNGAACQSPIPSSYSFNWYKLKVGSQGRYILKATAPDGMTNVAGAVAVDVYRASDLTRPVFSACDAEAAAVEINEVFPAGDYVVVVSAMSQAIPTDAGITSYLIWITPYQYVF